MRGGVYCRDFQRVAAFLSKLTYVPIAGLLGDWVFRLADEAIDGSAALAAIRVPISLDLIAAVILERLCQQLRLYGFPFAAAETGNGAYAASVAETSEIQHIAFLARINDVQVNPAQYELHIGCRRPTVRRLFHRIRAVDPSDREREVWNDLENRTTQILKDVLGVADLSRKGA